MTNNKESWQIKEKFFNRDEKKQNSTNCDKFERMPEVTHFRQKNKRILSNFTRSFKWVFYSRVRFYFSEIPKEPRENRFKKIRLAQTSLKDKCDIFQTLKWNFSGGGNGCVKAIIKTLSHIQSGTSHAPRFLPPKALAPKNVWKRFPYFPTPQQ